MKEVEHYGSFEDWFHGIDRHGVRSQKFKEDFMHMTSFNMIEWLRLAYAQGYYDALAKDKE